MSERIVQLNVDGIYLRRNRGGEFENVAILVTLKVTVIQPAGHIIGSLFKKILHRAAKDFSKTKDRLRAGFINILIALLIHLDGAEADIRTPSQFCLRASVCCADTFQIGFRKMILHPSIHNVHEFGDIRFMERIVHFL